MKFYVEEDGSGVVREAIGAAELLATSVVAYVEARVAFARKRHEGAIPLQAHRGIVGDLDEDWNRYLRVEVGEPLLRQAALLAEAHRLRAYDAIHLASARLVAEQLDEALILASWDSDLERAASREGLESLRTRRPR